MWLCARLFNKVDNLHYPRYSTIYILVYW